MKREAKWQILWTNYLRKTNFLGYFELKQTRGDVLKWDSFESHQLDSLMALEKGGLVWKLSDADPRQKPCDCLSTPPLNAYVVIKYPRAFVVIRINNFILAKNTSKFKFLSYSQAIAIAEKIIHV